MYSTIGADDPTASLVWLTSLSRTRVCAVAAAFIVLNLIIWSALGSAKVPLDEATMSESNYASPMYGSWTWWMVRGFIRRKPVDVVLLGSSQIDSASWSADVHTTKKPLDCLLHREVITLEQALQKRFGGTHHVAVQNCAVQGGMASDYYMIERTLFLHKCAPHVVVIVLSPRDFIDNKLPSASSTEVFRFCSRFVDPGKLAGLAYADVGARYMAAFDSMVNKLPLRRLSDLISAQSRDCLGRLGQPRANDGKALAQAIYSDSQQVKIGQWTVPVNVDGIFIDNSKEYLLRYANPHPKSYPIQIEFFQQALRDLKDLGCQVLIVEMPTLKCNRDLLPQSFWYEYRNTLQKICRTESAVWCDLSDDDEFQKTDYVDTVHLNDRGGIKFISKLASIICTNKHLCEALVPKIDVANRRNGSCM